MVALGKEFFTFFVFSLPSALSGRHPAKKIFLKSFPGALTLALGKATKSKHEEFPALQSAKARAPDKASKVSFFIFLFYNHKHNI
jgi:hypothetical protein